MKAEEMIIVELSRQMLMEKIDSLIRRVRGFQHYIINEESINLAFNEFEADVKLLSATGDAEEKMRILKRAMKDWT